ncbi:hypothetical protein BDZ90DRAFT_261017 [Jaminaea rosea]|uniref:Uncharacterized protein n=1 Tax=Jaminaea rosea TaxID=1569628 RepID=A0A316UR25_9BASI|nr:hypothetical protein BDZ90DRAFT_261017 [Jaminaea rosea]PWN26761.1 hypothetical protein BDZ90DRAFT_261017 [Jaminaea rosea]
MQTRSSGVALRPPSRSGSSTGGAAPPFPPLAFNDDQALNSRRVPAPVMPPRSKTRPLHLHTLDQNVAPRTHSLQQISALHNPSGATLASQAQKGQHDGSIQPGNSATATQRPDTESQFQDIPDDFFASIDDESLATNGRSPIAAIQQQQQQQQTQHTDLPVSAQHRPSLPAALMHGTQASTTNATASTRRSAPPMHVRSPHARRGVNFSRSSPRSSPGTAAALMPPPQQPRALTTNSHSQNVDRAHIHIVSQTHTTSDVGAQRPSCSAQSASSHSSPSSSHPTTATMAGLPPQSCAFRMVQKELSCAQAKNRRYLGVIEELERTVVMLRGQRGEAPSGVGGSGDGSAAQDGPGAGSGDGATEGSVAASRGGEQDEHDEIESSSSSQPGR